MMTRSQINIYAAEAKRISRQLSTTHTHRKQAPLAHAWAAAMKGALSNGDPRAVLCGEEEAMHYYQFHVGDYRRDTAHLTLLEHGAYRQLLDWYYLDETPIPKETDLVFRRLSARTDEEKKAVLAVLNDFFMLTDAGYVQERADEEIRAYQNRADIARENGKKGGRPRKTTQDDPTDNPAGYFGKANGTQQKANQEPLTNNQYIPPNPLAGGESSAGEKPKRERKLRITLKTFVAGCAAAGEKPVSDYLPMAEYIDATGLPTDFVQLAWEVFKGEHLGDGVNAGRLQADWRRHFLNYVKKGYYRLWYAKSDGSFELTTNGIQAKSFAESREAA